MAADRNTVAESILANIKGIKVAYPSNAADFKGLFKSSFMIQTGNYA